MSQASFGACPICGQGDLVPVARRDTGVLLLICDDCEARWGSPQDALSYQKALVTESEVRPATDSEIRATRWSAFVIGHLLDEFVTGRDTALHASGRLEVLLDDTFPEDDTVQEIVEVLARYRPGGGEFLFDTSEVQDRLARLKIYLGPLLSSGN